MKKSHLILSLTLVFALATACTPQSAATTPAAAATEPPVASLSTATLAAPLQETATEPSVVEEATALPLATSRGPELHATDPTTVSLASGGLHFVEFFRFT